MKVKRKYPESVPLVEAMLCEDCKEITASKKSTCAICGSTAIWPLTALLEPTLDSIVDNILRTMI